jgi:hypothetical protein
MNLHTFRRVALGVALGVVLGFGAVAFAQTPSFPINTPLTISATHDGLYTTTYHLAIGGVGTYAADLPVSALTGGVIAFNVPGLPTIGNYQVVLTAIGPGGSTSSTPFAFTLVAPKPSNFGPITVKVT